MVHCVTIGDIYFRNQDFHTGQKLRCHQRILSISALNVIFYHSFPSFCTSRSWPRRFEQRAWSNLDYSTSLALLEQPLALSSMKKVDASRNSHNSSQMSFWVNFMQWLCINESLKHQIMSVKWHSPVLLCIGSGAGGLISVRNRFPYLDLRRAECCHGHNELTWCISFLFFVLFWFGCFAFVLLTLSSVSFIFSVSPRVPYYSAKLTLRVVWFLSLIFHK